MALACLARRRGAFLWLLTDTSSDFGHFPGFGRVSGGARLAFVEDQPVAIVSQIAKSQFRLGADQTDSANEKSEPVILMSEDVVCRLPRNINKVCFGENPTTDPSCSSETLSRSRTDFRCHERRAAWTNPCPKEDFPVCPPFLLFD